MAQCNLVTGCCGACAVLSFILAAVNYVLFSNIESGWDWFSSLTENDSAFNKTVVFNTYEYQRVEPDDEIQVYYVSEGDVDCQATAATIDVTFSCEPASDTRNGKVKELKAACEERDNSRTGVTVTKVLTWAAYADDDNGLLVEGKYTVVAPVPIFVWSSWDMRFGESFLQFVGVLSAMFFSACGAACCLIGLVVYACTASPITHPQVQMIVAAPQMQVQPLQQPMYGQQVANPAYGQGQHLQYGAQPVNPAYGQYGQYGAQPVNPAYGQEQAGQHGAQPYA